VVAQGTESVGLRPMWLSA